MRHRLLHSWPFRAGTIGVLACAWLACLNPRPEEWPSNADGTSTTSPAGGAINGAGGGADGLVGEAGSASDVPAITGGGAAGSASQGPSDAGPADAAPDANASARLTAKTPSDAGVSSEEERD